MKMKKAWILLIGAMLLLGACGRQQAGGRNTELEMGVSAAGTEVMLPTKEIVELEEGLSLVRYDGDYGFETFLSQGGASSDQAVASFLKTQVLKEVIGIDLGGFPFGCSTIAIANQDGGYLFGRNFDWNACDAMIVASVPEEGYASVSTVNMGFIQAGGVDVTAFPNEVQAMVALYVPLDGMNEQGFAISVNMIDDSADIEQNTGKPDITTTTAIRLLLNHAATVEEAIALLEQYDMHGSMGMMTHFAMADANGRSVVVEYVDQEMVVVDTPIVTNFYLAEGSKYGIGSSQSHSRYEILEQTIAEQGTMNAEQVRDALDSVSKDNFNEFESTEWSVVMNQSTKELTYYHRENYEQGYTIAIDTSIEE